MMEHSTATERQQVEIELLEAMYPDQTQFSTRRSEVKYEGTSGGSLVLRIPESYPEQGLPDVISAVDATKNDIRTKTKAAIDDMRLSEGEEVLDAIIQAFESLLANSKENDSIKTDKLAGERKKPEHGNKWKTVIIWLHHLLNTNKRKLALSPTLVGAATDGGQVSGVTKPGYPGILVYSGPAELVNAHVAELRQQRWQAFQVRYEEECDKSAAWTFGHGAGVVEVESMSDVVQSIGSDSDREAFLKATGVK